VSVVDGVLTDVEGDEFRSADAELIRTIKQGIVRAEKRKMVARMALGRMRAKAEGRAHLWGILLRHRPAQA
jgi:hypothetical protein